MVKILFLYSPFSLRYVKISFSCNLYEFAMYRYELYFAFACIWAFGSALFKDQLIDWRNEFSRWWLSEFKTVKFPAGGTIFSYFVESETKKLLPWTELVTRLELDLDIPLQVCAYILLDFPMKREISISNNCNFATL